MNVGEIVQTGSLGAVAGILAIVLKDRRQFTRALLDSCVARIDKMDAKIAELNQKLAECEGKHAKAAMDGLDALRKMGHINANLKARIKSAMIFEAAKASGMTTAAIEEVEVNFDRQIESLEKSP